MHDPSGLPPDVAISVVLGAAAPGTEVPELEVLVQRSGLPATDVVAGIEALMDRRAIELVPGSRRLVTRRIPYHLDDDVPPSLTEGVRRSGTLRPGVQWRSLVRSVEEHHVNFEQSQALGVRSGRVVLRIVRDRLIGDTVVGHGDSYLRTDMGIDDLVDGLFEHGSLAAVIARSGQGRLRRLSYDAALRVPPAEVGEHFGPAATEPAWYLESVNTLDGVTPAELSRGWLRADHFRLV